MFKARHLRRFEPLESRMMLSVNVSILDNTIFVTSDDGSDDWVDIYENKSKYLVVKDHGNLVEKIDLRQFDEGWNLNVNLDGGDDHLYIGKIRYGLNRLEVDTGYELGAATSDTDNDWVKISYVRAESIEIYTGARVGPYQTGGPDEVPPNDTLPYQDNDVVKVYDTHTYSDLMIDTAARIGVGPNPAVTSTEEDPGDPSGRQMQDNDRVDVSDSHVKHGNLDIRTGMEFGAVFWQDTSTATEEIDGEPLASLQDKDYVRVAQTQVYDGNLYVNTGLSFNLGPVWDDSLTDSVFAEIEETDGDFDGFFDDQDVVKLDRVKVQHDNNRGDPAQTEFINEAGSINIQTGANIFNGDMYTYLAVQTYNDDDKVFLNCVDVYNSLSISTGAGANGMIGDGNDGDGYSDRDRVQLKHVNQKYSDGTTNVWMGDDDDRLRIYKSSFQGFAVFDGGDGTNIKMVAHTTFANPPEFNNFENGNQYGDRYDNKHDNKCDNKHDRSWSR